MKLAEPQPPPLQNEDENSFMESFPALHTRMLRSLPPAVVPSGAAEMGKFMKPRNVVLILAGCYSRCKEVIVKNIDDGTSDRP